MSKNSIRREIADLKARYRPRAYLVEGWVFEEERPGYERCNHLENQIHLGFQKSSEEAEAFHKDFPESDFAYVGNDYWDYIQEYPDEAPYTKIEEIKDEY